MSLSQEAKTPTGLDPHAPTANGSPPPATYPAASNGKAPGRAMPSDHRKRGRGWLLVLVAGFLGLVILGGGIAAVLYFRKTEARPDVLLHQVKKEDLKVNVTEKGTLESAQNM